MVLIAISERCPETRMMAMPEGGRPLERAKIVSEESVTLKRPETQVEQ